MNIGKHKYITGIVLLIAVFALIGGWSSAEAREVTVERVTLNCVDAYSGGPDFLYNSKPESSKAGYSGNCLLIDNGPTFLVNAQESGSRSPEPLVECPQVQSGTPIFLVNTEPTINLTVAGADSKCSPG